MKIVNESTDVLIIGGGRQLSTLTSAKVTRRKIMPTMRLPIEKDAQGNYVQRGWRNVKINGENIKPQSDAVKNLPNVEVLNHVNIADFFCVDGKILGAYGFSTREKIFYSFKAKITLIATGGASGLYLPNHAGGSRHQMWDPPLNTGAGYLRCKDTTAPTGTLAGNESAAVES